MTQKYLVDFNAGAGNQEFDTLEEAKVYAEENLNYTGETVVIRQGNVVVAYLPWFGTAPDVDDEVTAAFGTQGFYGEWTI